MIRSHRRHAAMLVLVLGITAFLAQLAGVGANRSSTPTAAPGVALAALPGGAVPDRTSTQLDTVTVEAKAGDVLRMRGTAKLRAGALGSAKSAQVVCGIRYARKGDASWSLGDPYKTVVLRRGGSVNVDIERSFNAPADDSYRMISACHIAAPADGATVMATGTMRVEAGLPQGSAVPVE